MWSWAVGRVRCCSRAGGYARAALRDVQMVFAWLRARTAGREWGVGCKGLILLATGTCSQGVFAKANSGAEHRQRLPSGGGWGRPSGRPQAWGEFCR
uniref:Secreted protein n=1 Tax=Calidris pygmaea TaxID=425635 RepID=A0A8C3KCF4_9CHAR